MKMMKIIVQKPIQCSSKLLIQNCKEKVAKTLNIQYMYICLLVRWC